MIDLGDNLFVEPVATEQERADLVRWTARARSDVSAFFGADRLGPAPVILVCATSPCARATSGPSGRSRVVALEPATVTINGIGPLTRGTITHEWVDVEIARRIGPERIESLPAWFDDGVATFLGDNVVCPSGTPRAVDDLRRLEARWIWGSFTDTPGLIGPAYCQVRDEVAGWVARHDRAALLAVIDAVAAGEDFDAAYGPVPGTPPARRLVADYRLDDAPGPLARDRSGWTGPAPLLASASWTSGRRGGAVDLADGSHLRVGGLSDLGLPDGPFTVALWVRPQQSAGVLVHSGSQPDGAGWCVPLLGYDADGRLAAQVSYAPRPDALLTALGPRLVSDRWAHLAVTWSAADGLRLYVDGSLVAVAAPQTAAERHRGAPGSPMFLLVGTDNGASCWTDAVRPGAWRGAIDDLEVYDYALTAREVARAR